MTANVQRIAHDLGLNTRTVQDLLESGWTYESSLDEPGVWRAPLYPVDRPAITVNGSTDVETALKQAFQRIRHIQDLGDTTQ